MRVKRYIVDSMPDALQRIRSDLGNDAVILNTKDVKTGGFLGMFSKKKIEVIAAIDTASAAANLSATVQKPSVEMPVISQAKPVVAPTQQHSAATTSIAVMEEEEDVNVRTFPESRLEQDVDGSLADEIKQMKKLVQTLIQRGYQQDPLPEHLIQIEQCLKEQEVNPELIQQIFHKVIEKSDVSKQIMTEEHPLRLVAEEIKEIFNSVPVEGISDDTKIVNFVGPTGVGKTTSIAKLAAEQVLKKQKKVGFITSDTYRIAAVEQLKTYATILNAPLEVINSSQDLHRALEKLSDCDIIFMDTAGRNFRNEMYVSEINSLLRASEKSESFLVLSLTMKYKDMKAVTENFSKFSLDKVLFTKKDETDTFGSILNIVNDFSFKLSYIADGQSVPDDISVIDTNEIIADILEEAKDE